MGNQTDGVFCLQARSPYLTALTFFQGIVWMHLCADELVGLFQAAGRAAGSASGRAAGQAVDKELVLMTSGHPESSELMKHPSNGAYHVKTYICEHIHI